MLNQKRITSILRWNLALAFAEGLLVLWSFLKQPSEPGSAVFFGFSYLRWALILIVFVCSSALLILFFGSFRGSAQNRVGGFLVWLVNQKWTPWLLILWMVTAYILLFLSKQYLGSLASYRERLLPILLWFALLSVQLGLNVLYLRGISLQRFNDHRRVLVLSLVILILLGFLLLIIKVTHIGLTPDYVYWQGPGVPILLSQVFLAVVAGTLFYLFLERSPLGRSNRLDLVVFLGLWGLACLLWLNQPAKLTYFSLEPRAPNFQIYPFSDALIYDSTAQEFLIGKPIPSDLWVKPIYSLFLALLHLFSGENYTLLVSLQVAILAIIPSFIYKLTASLDNRPAGLVAALLIILRERNAIALSNIIQVSHSKLLLSDVFAMGEMVLLEWLAVWWLQRPGERRAAPIAVGGMLGLLILTRGHTILMIPFIFLISFIVLKPNLKLWYESSWRIAIGLLLLLVPWFLRTYASTGKFAFQDPASVYAANDNLVKLYAQSFQGDAPVSKSSSSYNEFQSQAFKLLIKHPLDVAYLSSAHFFHNAIFSYIYLPGSFQIEDLSTYVKHHPFWNKWDGSIPPETRVLMLLNFAALSLGIAVTWKKGSRLVLVPLILGAAYNLSIAVTRRSGWRFILPADWVTLIFYAIGLIQFSVIVQSALKPQIEQPDNSDMLLNPSSAIASDQRSAVMFGLPFFLIGIGLVLGNNIFPLRYPAKSKEELLNKYQSALPVTSKTESSTLKNFVQKDQMIIVDGRALYPVYLKANEGVLNYNWLSYSFKPYNRLAFYLIGVRSFNVNLRMASPPPSFPDGSDVIVIGCPAEAGEINALSVLIQGSSPIHYISDPFPAPDCPASAP